MVEFRLVLFQSKVGLSCPEGTLESDSIEIGLRPMQVFFDTLVDAVLASLRNECLFVALIDFQKAYDFGPTDALFFEML